MNMVLQEVLGSPEGVFGGLIASKPDYLGDLGYLGYLGLLLKGFWMARGLVWDRFWKPNWVPSGLKSALS